MYSVQWCYSATDGKMFSLMFHISCGADKIILGYSFVVAGGECVAHSDLCILVKCCGLLRSVVDCTLECVFEIWIKIIAV